MTVNKVIYRPVAQMNEHMQVLPYIHYTQTDGEWLFCL